jgi:uncharacterized protein (DUF433 family)
VRPQSALQPGTSGWRIRERISVNPMVCHGKACIRGTRVMISVILDNLAAGVPHEDLLQKLPLPPEAGYPGALVYAAELAREGTAELPLEDNV